MKGKERIAELEQRLRDIANGHCDELFDHNALRIYAAELIDYKPMACEPMFHAMCAHNEADQYPESTRDDKAWREWNRRWEERWSRIVARQAEH